MEKQFSEIVDHIAAAKRVVLISHRGPDGDTIGSCLAMAGYLESIAKDYVLLCVDRIDEQFDFLKGVGAYVREIDFKEGDLALALDVAGDEMLGFEVTVPMINIDHHGSNVGCGFLNIVDANAASVTVLIYEFLKFVDAAISDDMATAMLLGIYTDTGSFMHSNTDKRAMAVAADLLAFGARIEEIVRRFFRTKSLSTLKLWGRVLSNTRLSPDDVVMSVVKEEDFVSAGADAGDLSGVVDYLNMVPEARYAVLLNEGRRGRIKGSLRTRKDDVDVAKIAQAFGGGGHSKASGFTLKGKSKELIDYDLISSDLSKKL